MSNSKYFDLTKDMSPYLIAAYGPMSLEGEFSMLKGSQKYPYKKLNENKLFRTSNKLFFLTLKAKIFYPK